MNTFELIEQLSKKSKEEIKYGLLTLMLEDKIDFVDLNKAYIEYLKEKDDDKENMLIECDTCLMDMMFLARNKKKHSKLDSIDKNIIQRALYRINQSNRFNTKFLNEEFEYVGDDEAKKLSWYERNKIQNKMI